KPNQQVSDFYTSGGSVNGSLTDRHYPCGVFSFFNRLRHISSFSDLSRTALPLTNLNGAAMVSQRCIFMPMALVWSQDEPGGRGE
ncbi:hypothetical protein, partial [Aeromonas allosaccharophila]|uniref:hypothetical protein n=1 Tax=Aeromonas allosaccharophila TaxID=656 RepID=UPI003D25065C